MLENPLYLLGCPASLSENWRITSITYYSSRAGFCMSGALFAPVFISDAVCLVMSYNNVVCPRSGCNMHEIEPKQVLRRGDGASEARNAAPASTASVAGGATVP